MQIGKGKQGVSVVEYGDNGSGYIGYVEPVCENKQWIMWFDAKGNAEVYTAREPSGAILGEPLRLKARISSETKHQREVKRLREEIEQLQVQLAGCLMAADGGTKDIAKKGSYGWSPAYQAVLDLRKKFDNLTILQHSLPIDCGIMFSVESNGGV